MLIYVLTVSSALGTGSVSVKVKQEVVSSLIYASCVFVCVQDAVANGTTCPVGRTRRSER